MIQLRYEWILANMFLCGGGIYLIVVGYLYREESLHIILKPTTSPLVMSSLGQGLGGLLVALGLVGIFPKGSVWSSRWNSRIYLVMIFVSSIALTVAAAMAWATFAQAMKAFENSSKMLSLKAFKSFQQDPEYLRLVAISNEVCNFELDYICNKASPSSSLAHLLPLRYGYYQNGVGFLPLTNGTRDVVISTSQGVEGYRAFCANVPEQVQMFGPAIELASQYRVACACCGNVTAKINQFPRWMEEVIIPSTSQYCINARFGMLYPWTSPGSSIAIILNRWQQYALLIAPAYTCLSLFSIYVFESYRRLGHVDANEPQYSIYDQ